MITVEDLSYGVHAKELFKDISFTIQKDNHCALIGINGTGKTTLVNLILHPEEYMYDGSITIDEEIRIGYASQFAAEDKSRDLSVSAYLAEEILNVQDAIEKACEEIAHADDYEAAFEAYQTLLDLYDSMDGDHYESNIHKALYTADLLEVKDRSISEISGGEYKMIQVIREMIAYPDLLVLDEPDAFLDFKNLAGLARIINEYKGAILVVTHNRYLLNHCFNKILHLEKCQLFEYERSYTMYRAQQLRDRLEIRRQYEAEQDEIARTEEMVEILRKRATIMVNPTIGRSVNAKQSYLDRLLARQIDAPVFEIREASIQFPEVTADPETEMLQVHGYSVAFEEEILSDVNFTIHGGEKVAVVGANGAGKTALVKDIIKNSSPAIHIDDNASVAFLSQVLSDAEELEKTTYQYLQDQGFGGEESIKKFLSVYGLDDIEIHQKMKTLSVGERNLLQIAVICSTDADFLILDEPSSHLDIYTQKALENALTAYQGTVFLISHDFYLIANCTDYVLLIEDGSIRRMRARKFRKMVYDRYFDQKYLELDKKKQELESDIEKTYRCNELDRMEQLIDALESLS